MLYERLVSAAAHKLSQGGFFGYINRVGCDMRLGVAAAIPIEVDSPWTPTTAVVLANDDNCVLLAIAKVAFFKRPADRQLPTHIWLSLDVVQALTHPQVM